MQNAHHLFVLTGNGNSWPKQNEQADRLKDVLKPGRQVYQNNKREVDLGYGEDTDNDDENDDYNKEPTFTGCMCTPYMARFLAFSKYSISATAGESPLHTQKPPQTVYKFSSIVHIQE